MSWYRRLLDRVAAYFRPHQRGPVRRIFSASILTLTVAGLLAASNLNSPNTTVFLTSSNPVAIVGEQFFINVKVRTAREINAVAMEVVYPASQLRVDQLRDGESVLSIWTEPPVARNGVITLSGGTFRRGFTGEHRVMRIAATATEAGELTIRPRAVRLLVGDGTGDELILDPEQIKPFTIRVVSAADVPLNTLELPPGQRPITDLTGDGQVTMQDISIFMSAWNNGSPIFDFTGDGRMTFRDFSIILADFFRFRNRG